MAQVMKSGPVQDHPLYGSWLSVGIKLFLAWLKQYLDPAPPTPTPTGRGATPAGSLPIASTDEGLGKLRSAIEDCCPDKARVGSQLSVAIDWLIEKIKGYLTGQDWHHTQLVVEQLALAILLSTVIPSMESSGGLLALGASILKPILVAEKARVDAELAKPAPA